MSSTPSATTPPPKGDTKSSPSLSRFVRRASKLLKPRSRNSVDLGTPATESKSVSEPKPSPIVRPSTTMPPPPQVTDRAFSDPTQYLKQREEKARALFAKYGMTLSPEEWTSPSKGNTQWVEKKVVMRVHRQCHRCQTTFGREKVCNQCQHNRCKKCPRWPLKISTEQAATKGYDLDYSVLVDPLHGSKGGKVNAKTLTLQTKSGREAVRKQPTQRVRRTCHRCSTLFVGRATACENCQHPRCAKCPRDPPKLKKWPNGYPGDVEEQFPAVERVRKAVRLRYRWECHTCHVSFIEHEKTCRGCYHERCDECPRRPPKKVKREPTEDFMKSVEEKIKNISLGIYSEDEAATSTEAEGVAIERQ